MAEMEEMLMMEPPPLRAMAGMECLHVSIMLVTITFIR
jgi:hypothetical protein